MYPLERSKVIAMSWHAHTLCIKVQQHHYSYVYVQCMWPIGKTLLLTFPIAKKCYIAVVHNRLYLCRSGLAGTATDVHTILVML